MKRWQFNVALVLGVVCVGLSVALVVMAQRNQKLQNELQARQAQINSGILGPQAQQIAGNVLQEMAGIAETNTRMKALLQKHGYTLTQPAGEETAAAESEAPGEAATEGEE